MKKKHIPGELRYDCRENENHFYMNFVDGKLDELLFGNELEREWVVIGFSDLVNGLEKAGYRVEDMNKVEERLADKLSELEEKIEEEKKAGYIEVSPEELKRKVKGEFDRLQNEL